jgi:hypothetical protein
MRAAQILDHKDARPPIDVQEGAVTQEGRTYLTVQNPTRSTGAIFSACTAVNVCPCLGSRLSTNLHHAVHIYAVKSQLLGTLSAFETHEWNHVWNTSRAQQKDQLLPEDPGSIGDSLPGHSARFLVLWDCTCPSTPHEWWSPRIRLTTYSAFLPAGCRQRSGCSMTTPSTQGGPE